jgi:hypothetical protein
MFFQNATNLDTVVQKQRKEIQRSLRNVFTRNCLCHRGGQLEERFPSTLIVFCKIGLLCTWSVTLKEEHRLRVFESMVLRRIFGPKRDEVTGGLRKVHNEGAS